MKQYPPTTPLFTIYDGAIISGIPVSGTQRIEFATGVSDTTIYLLITHTGVESIVGIPESQIFNNVQDVIDYLNS